MLASGFVATCSAVAALLRRGLGVQPRQHVQDMFEADTPVPGAFQRQFHRHQHGVKTGRRHDGRHPCQHAVAARVAQQRSVQMLQRLGHVGEGRAIA